MKKARLPVDFNEMIGDNLILLSQTDFKTDSEGSIVELKEGLEVQIYEYDLDEFGEPDNIIAKGVVELNKSGLFKICKWNCRIDKNGVYHESEINQF